MKQKIEKVAYKTRKIQNDIRASEERVADKEIPKLTRNSNDTEVEMT